MNLAGTRSAMAGLESEAEEPALQACTTAEGRLPPRSDRGRALSSRMPETKVVEDTSDVIQQSPCRVDDAKLNRK